MYRVNRLGRNVLIMPDEVIFHAHSKHNIDHRNILPSIIPAEERFVSDFLGIDFYEELIAEKNVVVTAANKATLEGQINADLVATAEPNETPETVTLIEGQIVNSSSFLSAKNKALWDRHLWKYVAECVRIIAMPQNFAQLTSQGLLHDKPGVNSMSGEGSVSPDLKSVRWLVDSAINDIADPLRKAMHRWVCAKKTDYPKYIGVCDECENKTLPKGSSFVTGIYDDKPDECKNQYC